MRQKTNRKIYFHSQAHAKPLPEGEVALLLELYSVWKEQSWHWRTGICVQIEKKCCSKLQAVHRNKKELLYINVLTSTVLFILNYTFVNGLMWLNSQVKKQTLVAVHQNREVLYAFTEFCNSGGFFFLKRFSCRSRNSDVRFFNFFFSIHIWVLECKFEWIKYSGSMLAADVQKRRHTEKARSITEGLMILSSWKPINYCRYKTKTY